MKTMEIKFKRIIAGTPAEVYSSWMNPKIPGTPWNEHKKLILNFKLDGFFYWLVPQGVPHYGRFTKIQKGKMIRHTWMSPYTQGLESTVTVTFKKAKEGTLMTLTHSGLPKNKMGAAHNDGWNYFLDGLVKTFASKKRR